VSGLHILLRGTGRDGHDFVRRNRRPETEDVFNAGCKVCYPLPEFFFAVFDAYDVDVEGSAQCGCSKD
jgi:predicted esterase